MKTIQISQRSEHDGKLRLEIPVEKPGHTYQVVIVVSAELGDSTTNEDWPTGYLESVIGKWEGEFVLESEGPFEQREPL